MQYCRTLRQGSAPYEGARILARRTKMQDIRCGSCNKKLGAGEFLRLEIKCPRCGTLNSLRAMSPQPERHRAPDQENHDPITNYSLDGRQAPPGRQTAAAFPAS
ncbi:Com family DNA-binding transcriptional regulator [Massilia sp. NR 4-1]|uniref:Com family DNA-binding transcriptional regulator n=1 Tax=Massilia sp. NR 4-1 TaxID=1678028 RepID=UPI0027D82E55|nr:Com family DNA-binding transcriptional regulator [Massilia sp. NR 4-1]